MFYHAPIPEFPGRGPLITRLKRRAFPGDNGVEPNIDSPGVTMTDYRPIEYHGTDGLRLFARDYPPAHPDAPIVLCLHGLTRNSADFEPLCEILSPHYRLIVPDQRGRGSSQRDPNPENYSPTCYNGDMLTLLEGLSIDRVHIIGTSMGGIMGMLLAAQYPHRVASLILNDIGPDIDLEGVRQIADRVGTPRRYSDWEDAVRQVTEDNRPAFPDFNDEDWRTFTRRLCRSTESGVEPDYDPAIGEAFAHAGEAAAPDLWPVFQQLGELPILVIRGALSNILAATTCERMRLKHPSLTVVNIANRGHAPILDEPGARDHITAFLARHAS